MKKYARAYKPDVVVVRYDDSLHHAELDAFTLQSSEELDVFIEHIKAALNITGVTKMEIIFQRGSE